MRTPLTDKQAHALGHLLSTMPAACEIDPLGNPGQEGPMLVDFDRLSVVVTEAGVCCLHDAEWIGAVE